MSASIPRRSSQPGKIVVKYRKTPVRRRQVYYFIVVALNGKTLATSEKYTNQKDCLDAARQVGMISLISADFS